MSQGLRQASIRAVSGTTLTYEGDWHAMWDVQGIAAGTFNERMIRYANTKLSATYTNVNDAMQALAVAAGATNFGSIGTYSFALGPVPVNSVAPTLSPTTGSVGTLVTCGTGTWSNTPTSYAYQWMRGGVDISAATASTYTTVLADDATTITCKVRASNANGPAAGYTTTSNSHLVGAASLLDSYTVGAAYSVRKLRSAYAGNCVRIRRSSDNAEQDFGFVSDVVDTAGIATFIGGGSGFAVTWYDQSGNALDVTNATAANQPLYVASGFSSKPTVRFNGLSQSLKRSSVASSTLTNMTETTIMASVYIIAPLIENGLLVWSPAGNAINIWLPHSGTWYWDFGGGAPGSSRVSVAWNGAWYNSRIMEAYRTTAGVQAIAMDGTTAASGSGYTAQPTGAAADWVVGTNVSNCFNGDISEIFILKTDIGSTARGTVRANMGAYYGITVA